MLKEMIECNFISLILINIGGFFIIYGIFKLERERKKDGR